MSDQQHCKDYLTQISDFIDGDLHPQLCAQLEEHLQNCENCTIVVNTMKRTIELYRVSTEPQEIPQDVRARLFKCLYLDDFRK
ncbi:MAG: hypothetical protein FD147_1850 [Chloroflexi bacterium]|nr:MAG: hypothetical protein FD147_1850 [Chloroflexota bacterium]MBA4375677.1 anti-sigma factor [Anaerolinea sp.]